MSISPSIEHFDLKVTSSNKPFRNILKGDAVIFPGVCRSGVWKKDF